MPDGEEVLVEQRGAVQLLTFNRPEVLNAWTPPMQRRYFELLDKAEQKVTVMQENMQGELTEQPFAAEEEAK